MSDIEDFQVSTRNGTIRIGNVMSFYSSSRYEISIETNYAKTITKIKSTEVGNFSE